MRAARKVLEVPNVRQPADTTQSLPGRGCAGNANTDYRVSILEQNVNILFREIHKFPEQTLSTCHNEVQREMNTWRGEMATIKLHLQNLKTSVYGTTKQPAIRKVQTKRIPSTTYSSHQQLYAVSEPPTFTPFFFNGTPGTYGTVDSVADTNLNPTPGVSAHSEREHGEGYMEHSGPPSL